MPGLMAVPSSPSLGAFPNHPTSVHNAPTKPHQSYLDIRSEIIENLEKQIRGASVINLIRTARTQLAIGKDYEGQGDLKNAYAAFVRTAKIMQVVMDSNEIKSERGVGILKKEIQGFMGGDAKDISQRIKSVETKLQEMDAATPRPAADVSSAVPPNHVGSGIAERMRALQRQGLEVMPKRPPRDPITNLPGVPTRHPHSPPQKSPPYSPSPIPQVQKHALVSPSTLGPPSPTSTPTSSPQFPNTDLLEFSQTFPSIEELDSTFAIPAAPEASSAMSAANPQIKSPDPSGHNGPAFKAFPMPTNRPSSTPITPISNVFDSRPASPSRLSNATKALNAYQAKKPQLPITNTISPTELVGIMNNYNLLIVDLRNRADFDREHIRSSAVICIEPIILSRKGVDAEAIENAMVNGPRQESAMFSNRDKFELIVMYDQCSRTPKDNQIISIFLEKIYDVTYKKPLKRSPVLLVGGIEAWKQEAGDSEVSRNDTTAANTPTSSNATDITHSTVTPIPPSTSGSKPPFYVNGTLISAVHYATPTDGTQFWSTTPLQTPSSDPTNSTRSLYGHHSRTPAESISNDNYSSDVLSTRGPGSISYPSTKSINGTTTSLSQPSTDGGIIAYPHPPRRISPTGMQQNVAYQFSPGTHPEIPSPPQASINPSPSSWRRSDFIDQSQEALATLQGRPLQAYPELRPPPAAAASVLDRQDNRPRLTSSLTQFPVPPVPPRINSDWPVPYWNGIKVGTSGLKNLGNTCYMNAPIQCLSATVPFARFFTDGRWKTSVNAVNPLGSKGILTGAFAKLLHEMWGQDLPYLTPMEFRKIICRLKAQYNGSDQHDSQEFLSFLIDGIHEDLNRVIVKPRRTLTAEEEEELERLPVQLGSEREWRSWKSINDSLIVDFFQGQFRSRLECLTCHKTSTTYNAFSILQLPIPHVRQGRVPIGHCLDTFFKEETLENDNAWDCPRCKTKRSAIKQLSLARLPPILMIHFKRFEANGRFSDKVDTFVDFPMKALDLTRFMPSPLSTGPEPSGPRDDPRTQLPPYLYELYGVTNHYGNLSSGHYTACIQSQNEWLYCDDSTIKRMDPKAVVNQKAYVLFYKRVNVESL